MYRDLNDIIPPSKRRALEAERGPAMDMRPAAPQQPRFVEEEPVPPMAEPPRRRVRGGGGRFPYGTALIALIVVLVCGGILYAFAGAKVSIVPVTNAASIDTDLSATAGQGDLPFQIVTVQKTATANVPSEGTVTATDPASGKVTITNRQTVAQSLIKNTRFETPNGLIFRIHDSISIPAGGSISATVYADEAGDKYNIGPTTFTVPGLKGSKAYDLVTAKSDAPMSGGFSGTRASVGQATKDAQYTQIQSKLSTDLLTELSGKVPVGYVLVPGASVTTYAPQPDAAGPSNNVTLSEQGTITAVVFPADALARVIAFKSVGTYGGQPVTLSDVKGLTVAPKTPSIAPDATTFDFHLSGSTTIVWQVDPSKIAGTVAGKTRSSAEMALKSFPEVARATLVLRPFWASHFPGDPAKIKVTVSGQESSK
ncbi:MAG: hypothetical protein ACM3TU_01215 [Bacillota bacterium]